MNLTQIWQAALGTIQLQTSRQEFDTWLRGTALLSLDNGVATIGTVSPYHKDRLEDRYMNPVRHSLTSIVGFPVNVRIVIAPQQTVRKEPPPLLDEPSVDADDDLLSGVPVAAEPPRPKPVAAYHARSRGRSERVASDGAMARPAADEAVQLDFSSALRGGMLNPKYRFSSFIVGSSNRLAHAACAAVADKPARAYNPLFLYGGVGLGKTHLLHAIGNAVLDHDPEINVLYVSSEKFTNDLINAIRRQQTEEFRMRYRNIDVLLIDDIQFIGGKEGTQEEFFHTFNTLHSAAKQIVISSDRPPKAIVTLEERLRSRFEWGLIVDVQPPDLETRTAILRAKGEQLNMRVPPEVIDFLAHKIQSNIRELEGCLNRVAHYAELTRAPITTGLAVEALAELLDTSRRKRITPEMILQAVCDYYGVEGRKLKEAGRSRNVVIPRHVAMYLLREETDCSLVEIGQLLGGRDHTTVIHGSEKVAQSLNTDARLRSEVASIREKLYTN